MLITLGAFKLGPRRPRPLNGAREPRPDSSWELPGTQVHSEEEREKLRALSLEDVFFPHLGPLAHLTCITSGFLLCFLLFVCSVCESVSETPPEHFKPFTSFLVEFKGMGECVLLCFFCKLKAGLRFSWPRPSHPPAHQPPHRGSVMLRMCVGGPRKAEGWGERIVCWGLTVPTGDSGVLCPLCPGLKSSVPSLKHSGVKTHHSWNLLGHSGLEGLCYSGLCKLCGVTSVCIIFTKIGIIHGWSIL